MSHALTFAEIDGQHVELLPTRTVLSMFSLGGDDGGAVIGGATCQQSAATPVGLLQAVGIGVSPQTQQCIAPPVAAG
jgi:hypothetical protein